MAKKRAGSRVGLHYARTHLSELPRRVEAGEEITILRRGKPIARLVPDRESSSVRPLGQLQGQWELPDASTLVEPDREIDALFYGDGG